MTLSRGDSGPRSADRGTLAALATGTTGAVFVEYVTLLVLVAFGLCAAIAVLGVPLLQLFRYAQTMILIPFP